MADNRYKNIQILVNSNNKQYYRTVLYPIIIPQPGDYILQTDVTDSLDMLAYTYYGEIDDYWIIAICNNLITGGMKVPADIKLVIPNPSRVKQIKIDFLKLQQNG